MRFWRALKSGLANTCLGVFGEPPRETVSVGWFVGGVIFGRTVVGRFYILSCLVYIMDLGLVSFMRTAVGVLFMLFLVLCRSTYRKNLNNWTVCYVVQNSLLQKGGKKHSKNTAPPPLPSQKKKQRFRDLTERGNPDDIAHRPIIQVFTVCHWVQGRIATMVMDRVEAAVDFSFALSTFRLTRSLSGVSLPSIPSLWFVEFSFFSELLALGTIYISCSVLNTSGLSRSSSLTFSCVRLR